MKYLLFLALLLRLPLLNQSLWLDEGIEALALMGHYGPLLSYGLSDYQPPLYHFVAYAFTQLFGYSELVLRLPSLLSGILTVYFVTRIGEFFSHRRVGVIAGLLTATNPLLIYYSQEGRTYALTTFLATASFYYFLRLLRAKQFSLPPSASYLLLTTCYLLLTTCYLWTSYLAWFLLAALVIYTLAIRRYDIFKLQVLAGLSLLFWLPSFISSLGVGQFILSESAQWGRVVGGLSLKSLPLTWVKFNLGRISFAPIWLYGTIVLSLAVLHLKVFSKIRLSAISHRPLLLWLIAPVVLGLLTAIFLPVYAYFRVLFVLPAYLLLLALALSPLRSWITHLFLALNLIFLSIFWFTPRFHREDWRSLARDLATDSAPIAFPSRAQATALLYYGIPEDRLIEPALDPLSSPRIYYVRYAEDLFDEEQVGQANFRSSGYTMTEERVYPGIQVDVYENRH